MRGTNHNDERERRSPPAKAGGLRTPLAHTTPHQGGWVGAASSSLVRPPGHPGGEMPGDRHPACQPGGGAAPPPAQTYSRRRSPWTRRANETTWATSGRAPLMSAHVHMSERPCAPTWAQSASLNPCRRRQAFRGFCMGFSPFERSGTVHRAKRHSAVARCPHSLCASACQPAQQSVQAGHGAGHAEPPRVRAMTT